MQELRLTCVCCTAGRSKRIRELQNFLKGKMGQIDQYILGMEEAGERSRARAYAYCVRACAHVGGADEAGRGGSGGEESHGAGANGDARPASRSPGLARGGWGFGGALAPELQSKRVGTPGPGGKVMKGLSRSSTPQPLHGQRARQSRAATPTHASAPGTPLTAWGRVNTSPGGGLSSRSPSDALLATRHKHSSGHRLDNGLDDGAHHHSNHSAGEGEGGERRQSGEARVLAEQPSRRVAGNSRDEFGATCSLLLPCDTPCKTLPPNHPQSEI